MCLEPCFGNANQACQAPHTCILQWVLTHLWQDFAAVSQTWLRALITKIAGDYCLVFSHLEAVSRANNLSYRVVRSIDDEYHAR